jgi:hypothetical protein
MECVDRILLDLGKTDELASAVVLDGAGAAKRVAQVLARSAARPIAWATRA